MSTPGPDPPFEPAPDDPSGALNPDPGPAPANPPLPDAVPADPAEVTSPTPLIDHAPGPGRSLSGAELLARRLADEGASAAAPPRPSTGDLEIFFSLLGYHYGVGTLDAQEFSERWAQVEGAQSLAELYAITGDLTFPPPLAHIKDQSGSEPRRRRRWFR